MNRIAFFFVIATLFFLIDLYVYQAVRVVTRDMSGGAQRAVTLIYWGFTGLALLIYIVMQLLLPDAIGRSARTMIWASVLILYFGKFFTVIVLLVGDLGRLVAWVVSRFSSPDGQPATDEVTRIATDAIPRSEFLAKAALVAGAVPLVGFTYGILSGAHDYRVRRVKLALKNLPSGFNGMTIAQISDVHSGSFFNKTAVRGGVDLLLKQRPDIVFFTGDLVNSTADEVEDYIDVFNKIKAPLGVYSTLGNHDYGTYAQWPSAAAKQQNLNDLIAAHKLLGWKLMMDEHKILEQNGDKLALIGVQNLGFGPAALRMGNLAKAYRGTEDYPAKLLLSHDPTHWDAEVRPKYSDIDVMFAGHTHGAQVGVDIGGVKWSPAQYFYKQWAGLYEEGNQRLYVNRGYGYIGYPGRIGILPEITIFELVQG
ncbi:MAG: metallophosphoesterase [Bacteroidetes bacterium]|nr:metallophosphoesterase [Fibrella sp.]